MVAQRTFSLILAVNTVIISNCDNSLNRKSEPKLQSTDCDYCSLGSSNTFCTYRSTVHTYIDNYTDIDIDIGTAGLVLLVSAVADWCPAE